MLVATKGEGGLVPQVRNVCDGCHEKEDDNHQCSGVINPELTSHFPKRECCCTVCKK